MVEAVRVAEILDDGVGAATLLREVVEPAVRDVAVAAVREGVEAVRVVTEVLLLLREAAVTVLRVEADVLRVAVALLVRILLLPNEREAAADEAALRVEAPCDIAVRVAARRSISKERALLMLRPALRVENERSG